MYINVKAKDLVTIDDYKIVACTSLTLIGELDNWDDLKQFKNLTSLTIMNAEEIDLEFLEHLKLTKLDITKSYIKTPTITSQTLIFFEVRNCDLSQTDMKIVFDTPRLSSLVLEQTTITNVEFLNNLPNLKYLNISDHEFNTLTLTHYKLCVLCCEKCDLTEIKLNCPLLKTLKCSHNKLTDLQLEQCESLQNIIATDNKIKFTDIDFKYFPYLRNVMLHDIIDDNDNNFANCIDKDGNYIDCDNDTSDNSD